MSNQLALQKKRFFLQTTFFSINMPLLFSCHFLNIHNMQYDLILKAMTAMAAPQGAENTEGHGVVMLLFYLGLFAIFYFFLIRPQSQRNKDVKKMQEAMQKGDSVVTTGGILATVHKIKDDVVTLEIAEGVRIKVLRSAVTERTFDSSKSDEPGAS